MMETKKEVQALSRVEPQVLIQSAIDKGASVDTMERLVALAKDIRHEQAREAYYSAMAEFQRQCPFIPKSETAQIRTRSGSGYSYKYAPLDVIMKKITPVMTALGLSVSYRVKNEKTAVVAVCRISHEFGHYEESGEVTMPVEMSTEGGSGANPAQRVGIANTYAKRYALLAITGLAPQGEDFDGTAEKPTKTKSRPIVKAEVVEEERSRPEQASEDFSLESEVVNENVSKCHVTGVVPKRDKKNKLYITVETSDGVFYSWDEKRLKEIALTEGQDVTVEFERKESGDKSFRYIKTIEIAAPEAGE